MRSLVLCSGGLDSAVCLGLAAKDGEVETLTCNYGQSHIHEIESAAKLSAHYKVRAHHVISLPDIFRGGGSTLVDGLEPPSMSYKDLQKNEAGMSPTYVPFRNGNLLSIATAMALTRECGYVWFGSHADDAGHWAYPDCSMDFLTAMRDAIYVGSYRKVLLITPLVNDLKKDVVRKGAGLGVPFALSRSCYSADPVSCGKCPTCIERLGAFKANGLTDPIEYQSS